VAFLSDRTRGIVGLPAILKAGKSYVALNPSTPSERNVCFCVTRMQIC